MARYKAPMKITIDPNNAQKIRDRSGKKIIDNRIADRLSNPEASKMMRVTQKMVKSGIIEKPEIRAPDAMSEKILFAMGCSIVDSGLQSEKDYSLLYDETDTEVVDNPNKMYIKKFTKIKKQTITIDHIFKNQQDSIFKLDADIPNNFKLKTIEITKDIKKPSSASLTKIAVKAIDLSVNTPGVRAVRAFKGL
tara:strand:+ start:330 stop:908 length:579 start_codon:yes stop_codon:yes gene_type:complete